MLQYLVADSKLAQTQLGWQPKHAKLETIITHAWQWEIAHYNVLNQESK